ncbi:MAG TPA: FadR/GntR family transcriptional regulator [Thermomicrobiales bacterium]|nr:FadR/GntR family transcriptional regulator [Thermomicrobiales bacterium]
MGGEIFVEPVQRSRLYQQVVVQVCQLIQRGQIRPGDRLPPERELAEQFGVGRSSIREALRALEVAGLIESRHGSGAYVRDVPLDGIFAPLPLAFLASGDVVGDMWEMRAIVEPELAARAALRAQPDELAALERNLERQRAAMAAPRGGDDFLVADREFHTIIARASCNEVAVRVVHLLNQSLFESRRHFIAGDDRVRLAHTMHQEVFAALRSRDPQRAREAMRRHLQEVEEQILGELMRERGGGGPPAAGERERDADASPAVGGSEGRPRQPARGGATGGSVGPESGCARQEGGTA